MEYEIGGFSNRTDLEFELLEEVKETIEEEEEKILKEVYNNFFNISAIESIFEVIKKTDKGIILLNANVSFILVENLTNAEIGDIYVKNYDDLVKINNELKDTKKFKELFVEVDKWVEEGKIKNGWRGQRAYDRNLICVKDIEGEINIKLIQDKIEEHIEGIKKEEEEEKQKEEEEKKVEEEKRNTEEEEYNLNSEGDFSYVLVKGKILKSKSFYTNKNEFILNKNVNKLISYEQIKKGAFDSGDNLPKIEYLLNKLGISYTKIEGVNEIYEVVYTDGKGKVKGVYVPKSKMFFILNKINKGMTKEDISILVKLNGMKVDFIKLKDVGVNSLMIPIVSKAIDDRTFEIEFLGKKKIFDWEDIKKWFFYEGHSRSVGEYWDNKKMLDFCGEMNIDKIVLFRMMKRMKILKSLDDEDGS